MTHVLVLTTEPLPVGNLPATGAGLRAWGLAQGLRSRGLEVTALMPSSAAATYAPGAEGEGRQETGAPEPNRPDWVGTFDRPALREEVARRRPDVIVLQHWGLAAELGEVDCPLAIDLAGPHLLERRLWGSADPEADLREKLDALRRADFLVASGRRQRLYFLPYLMMAGWPVDAIETELLPVIPFSMAPFVERPHARADRFVYGGFFLPWQNPTTIVEAALEALEAEGRGELVFVGGPHPSLDVSRGRFEKLAARLEHHPRARLLPPMDFARYQELLAEGGVALDAMARNLERELAFPTRTVVYLAGGLPVIHHHYDELGEMIARAGAGWAVDPEDAKGIVELLRGILKGELDVDGPARSALDLVRRELHWDLTIGPLADFCRQPVFREGKTASRLRFEEQHRRLGRLEAELAESRRGLNTLRGKRWVRWGLGLTSARAWMRWPMALLAGLIGLALIPVFLVNDWIGRLGSRR